jgi:hypothetical protein
MHEVKVYDGEGKLKKVISVKKLTERSDKLFNTPSLYQKGSKKPKSPEQASETPENN